MSTYIIFDIEVTNPTEYEDYKKLAAPTLAQYGGKYVVRGGKHETVEGDWRPNRIVVLEFENSERANEWLNSPEYAPARLLRQKYAKSNAIVVEGV